MWDGTDDVAIGAADTAGTTGPAGSAGTTDPARMDGTTPWGEPAPAQGSPASHHPHGRKASRRERFTRRRVISLGVSLAVVVIGFAVLLPAVSGGYDAAGSLRFASALLIWLLAVSWPLWRAPERALAEPLRLRLRHRLVMRRLALLALIAADGGFIADSYWRWRRTDHVNGPGHYGDPTELHLDHLAHLAVTTGLALLLACVLLVALEPLLWLLWPAAIRRSVRQAEAAEALQDPLRFRYVRADIAAIQRFDPERGWLGRPGALAEVPAGPAETAPLTIRAARLAYLPKAIIDRPDCAITWDGEALVLTDRRKRSVRVTAGEISELVEVNEDYGRDRQLSDVLALDESGRYLVRLAPHEARFARKDLVALAKASGLPLAVYDLGYCYKDFGSDLPRLAPRLFPGLPSAPSLS
jgi:hypothetical protein